MVESVFNAETTSYGVGLYDVLTIKLTLYKYTVVGYTSLMFCGSLTQFVHAIFLYIHVNVSCITGLSIIPV